MGGGRGWDHLSFNERESASVRRKERQNSGFGFEFDFTHLNSIQLISICIYFLIFVLFYLRMGGGKKRCCCIEIETTMVFGGVGKFEPERKDLQTTQKRKEKNRRGRERTNSYSHSYF